MPSLATVATVGLLMVGAYAVGQHRPVGPAADPTVPAHLVETLAQARCALWVFEDGSATWEANDTVRSACYRKLTGTALFANPQQR